MTLPPALWDPPGASLQSVRVTPDARNAAVAGDEPPQLVPRETEAKKRKSA